MNPGDRLDQVVEKDLPLRENIRFLGRLLGDTLREQEGDEIFNLIERVRHTAVRFRRDGEQQAREELETLLWGLSHEATVLVVRAFTYFSQLSNIAEDLHYIRRRRAYQLAGSSPGRAICRALSSGLSPRRLGRKNCRVFSVEHSSHLCLPRTRQKCSVRAFSTASARLVLLPHAAVQHGHGPRQK